MNAFVLLLRLVLLSCRSSTVVCEHPNGAAATSHSVFNTDRGVNWEKASKLLEEEVQMNCCLPDTQPAQLDCALLMLSQLSVIALQHHPSDCV